MMAKRFLIVSGLVLLFLLLCGAASGEAPGPVADTRPSGQEFAPDQLLVRFRPWVARQRADEILSERGAARIQRVSALGVDVLRLPPGLSVERAVEVFSRLPEVEFAEPNYILWALAPSQVEIEDQWGLKKIQAPEAWGEIADKTSVLLAIVDTGIDRNHDDLAPNIWINADETPGNGVDDDGNGYVDDTWGWDFHNNDNDPYDDNMHGTLVSSVAAAVQDESGVAGVCPWCTLAAVKVLGADGSGYLDTVASGITYAADNGARVVSLSLGGASGAQTLENAVNYAWNKGALVVAAAGNDGADARLWPAAYANAMAIASTNDQDYRSCFSNFGEGYISVAAPGEAIVGAVPNQGYRTYSGTSLSTPHVSGLGGLLFSQDPTRTNVDVRSIIETTVNDLGPLGTDAYFGAGRINAFRAVTGDTLPTAPPAGLFTDDLTASGYAHARKLARDADGSTLHLVWHGRDGGQYRVLYATSNNGGASWSPPQVVFGSSSETFHPTLAIDGTNVYIAFPSKHNASRYRVFFTSKPLSGGAWSPPVALMGGSYHAVRPDLYYDPSGGKLHLVASSLDDAPYVYYTSSGDGGGSWSPVRPVNVDSTGGQKTRYADVHANGDNVYIAGRTVEFTFFGWIPRYRVFTIRSVDDGETWGDLTELAVHDGLLSGEYGVSLGGVGDRLYLGYEHAGAVYFRRSEGGASWSGGENVGSGAWPSVTQATDGQAWLMWESGGNLSLRHYTDTAWDPAETVGAGNYPNLKLGTTGGFLEWAATHCGGTPYRLTYASRAVAGNNPPVADDQSVTTAEDTPVNIALMGSDSDGDPLTYSLVTDPTNGSLSGTPPMLTYTPDPDFNGSDIFTFKVNDGTVDSDPATVSITVTPVNDPPVASAGGPYSGVEDGDIVFDGLSSSDPDGDPLSYSWDFGDYTTGTGISRSHAYAYGGTFTVTLTVTDGKGEMDTDSTTATVEEVNDPPVADANGPYSGIVRDRIAFDGSGSLDPDNQDGTPDNDQALTYSWDFGDGSTGTGVSPSHGYKKAGEYIVSLVVNDGVVDSDPATTTLLVRKANMLPVASFSYTCTELTCEFDGSGSHDLDGTIDSYDWDFGDGETASGVTVSHTYAAADTYTVTLSVTDNDGATDTDTQDVRVSEAGGTMHVGDLDGAGRPVGKNGWKATVTITVHDSNHNPVENATLSGTWTGGTTGEASCVTDGSGQCSLTSRMISDTQSSVTFTMDNMTHDTLAYDSMANQDPDGDSDGTTITVSK